jgi:hypothetical protein
LKPKFPYGLNLALVFNPIKILSFFWWWIRRCTLHLLAKPGPLSRMNELITRIVYVGPPQAEEFKYKKSFYLSSCERWGVGIKFAWFHMNLLFDRSGWRYFVKSCYNSYI